MVKAIHILNFRRQLFSNYSFTQKMKLVFSIISPCAQTRDFDVAFGQTISCDLFLCNKTQKFSFLTYVNLMYVFQSKLFCTHVENDIILNRYIRLFCCKDIFKICDIQIDKNINIAYFIQYYSDICLPLPKCRFLLYNMLHKCTQTNKTLTMLKYLLFITNNSNSNTQHEKSNVLYKCNVI